MGLRERAVAVALRDVPAAGCTDDDGPHDPGAAAQGRSVVDGRSESGVFQIEICGEWGGSVRDDWRPLTASPFEARRDAYKALEAIVEMRLLVQFGDSGT